MTWMLTASGKPFDLRHIDAQAIDVCDIAHHLSQINRYTGAAVRPYSVAEHSLFVVWILERVLDERNPNVLLAGLLHDAHEAYCTDLSSPMKRIVGDAWTMEETRLQRHVLAKFGLTTTWASFLHRVHQADMIALVTEREQLLPAGGPVWPAAHQHQALRESDWCFADLGDWTWDEWRGAFLERFSELTYARDVFAGDRLGNIVPITHKSNP